MMLLAIACMARGLANRDKNYSQIRLSNIASATRLIFYFTCAMWLLTISPAHAAYNLLTNGDFETPVLPNVNGNNLQSGPWSAWSGTNQLNPIRVNGAGYASGADNAFSGMQYLDLAGAGIAYQSFTLSSTQTISFGATFSNRESAIPEYTPSSNAVQVINSASVVVATSSTVNLTKPMGDEVWVSSAGSATLPAGTYTFRINLGDYAHVDAAYVRTTTVKIQKVTYSGFGGPFTYTQTNLASDPPAITTTAANTSTPSIPTQISVTNTGVAVTITEAANAAFTPLQTLSCSDASSAFTGNPASFGTLGTNVITIPVVNIVAGADITCIITSTKMPSITITKITDGGVGSFSFTGTSGFGSQTVTTTTAGLGSSGVPKPLSNIGLATTITENVPPTYVVTSISCTGMVSGGTATPNLATGSVAISGVSFTWGTNVSCTFTNTKKPTITITKISNGGVGGFTFTGTNGWTSQTISTITSGVGVTSTTQILNAYATATTITEAIPPTFILASISCTGMGSGGTATPNLATGAVVLNAAAVGIGADISCTFTNTKLIPGMSVTKTANTTGPVSVGSVITYSYVVSNTGNTTIFGVAVVESFNGNGALPLPRNELLSSDVAPAGDSTDTTANDGTWSVLGPGDKVIFTAPYTVTQADIDLLQ